MRNQLVNTIMLLMLAAAPAYADVPVTLRGSPESMVRQNEVARGHDLPFVETPAELLELEREGLLVRLPGNDDYELAGFVRHPQARPEMRVFIERLAAQYRAATGEKLVVTSLTRPASRQPGNAHALSVHPTGLAVDLRVSQRAQSREWLERTLLSLEEQGLLDVTRERRPPHYHVALFPEAYMAHAEPRIAREQALAAEARAEAQAEAVADTVAETPADAAAGVVGGVLLLAVPGALLGLAALRRRRWRSPD